MVMQINYSETLEFNAYQIEIESNRSESNQSEPKARENFYQTNFEYLIFFQIFMIRSGRTELELKASFALNLLNLMLYSGK